MTGWISTTQTTFSQLTCGTSYTFRVKGKNVAGTETSYASSVSATTAACSSGGGGGFVPTPVSLPSNAMIINNGEKETYNPLVTLAIQANDIKEIALANTADFAGSSFIPYKTSVSWSLSPGFGKKTVYVRFRSKNGAMSTMFQDITLLEKAKPPVIESITQSNSSTPSGCPLIPGLAYKNRLSPAVWLITINCTRRPFKNEKIYLTYFFSWKELLIISKEQLDAVPADVSGDLPLGPKYIPEHGTFIRIPSDPTIYYVLGKKKIMLGSEKVFIDLGYKKEWIVTADRTILDKYESLKTVSTTEKHLDLTLVKYPSSPKIYLVEYGKKRHVTDEKVLFHQKPFRFERVIDIRDTEEYPEGEAIRP
jgi:hypothetical protein